MATAVRRASSRKKRHSAAEVSVKSTHRLHNWFDETLSLLFAVSTLFLAVSIVSYRLVTREFGMSDLPMAARAAENLMGPLGHVTAAILFGAFGWCSFVLALYLAYVAVYFWRRDLDSFPVPGAAQLVQLFGLSGMLFTTAAAAAIVAGREWGGAIGAAISLPLIETFGRPGAAMLCVAFLFLFVALGLRLTMGQLVHALAESLLALLRAGFWRIPKALWSGISAALFHSASIIAARWRRWRFHRAKGRGLTAPPELPTPKQRTRSQTPPVTLEEMDEQDEAEFEPPPAGEKKYVVVKRRHGPDKSTGKLFAQVRRKLLEERKEEANPYIGYVPPELSLLLPADASVGAEDDEELRATSRQIEAKLRDFGILGSVTHVHPGPVITLFEFEPAPGVKVGRIAALQDDLAMSLRASSIRIIAPIPKRGTVGIEVPNRNREIVRLRDVLESEAFIKADSILSVPIGKDTYGDPVVVDIASMPHLLMAGATGTGKSVCINAILVSLLYRARPEDLGLILIDPKVLELSIYENIPHLRVPVVTAPRQARAVLEWAVREMERRYRYMQRFGVRNIDSYNRLVAGDEEESHLATPIEPDPEVVSLTDEQVVADGIVAPDREQSMESAPGSETLKPLPKLVIVIDELADLMLTVGRDIEELITRLAQKARAAGIHLIVATQRPSVDVITGLIKANFPARLSFRVSSRIDSRTILDSMGSEKLLGRGDMLFMLPGAEALRRVHGAFVSDAEVKRVVTAVKSGCKPAYDQQILAACEKALQEESQGGGEGALSEDEYDAMYDKCVELVVQKGQASTSMLQRAFRIGYNRAARIIEMMEREGVVGPMDGAKPREVLVADRVSDELKAAEGES